LCIHQLFERQASLNPDNVALVFYNTPTKSSTLTYQQLNEKANQLAHYLLEHHDVKPDTMVGLCIDRSMEMIIGILAILKAGGAYVPLDPEYPQDRLSYMYENSKLEVVLSQSHVQDVLVNFTGTVLTLDGLADIDNQPSDNTAKTHFCSEYDRENITAAQTGQTSSNLAYVIYTSGSTGKPKGVMLEHRSVVNFLWGMQQNLSVDSTDNVLALTSINFDIHVLELYLTWSQGASLVLASETQKRDPQLLAALIKRQNVSLAQATPSTWNMLIDIDWASERSMSILCGGEGLPAHVLSKLQRNLPNCRIYNMYGPTETTVWSSMALLEGDTIHLGKPIINTQLYLLDTRLQLVPKGVAGELYIGGDGLSRGYLNRADLTAQTFIDNPFYQPNNSASSKLIYKTGDLVRYLPDDTVEFIGRADDQVKIRGFRIELGEVETQLSKLNGVDSACVVAKTMTDSLQLVGYIKPVAVSERKSEEHSDEQAQAQRSLFIKAAFNGLKTQLPEYMMPSIIMVVEQWPLTPNGKIDRKALPMPDASALLGEYIAPQTAAERQLADIFAALLDIEPSKVSVT
ncbi:MAG: amino acid adenylation domain-containing protein, partial [Algicola sp.]|nr:amino acid adenylation domain-containing protein [Algicola sp.]